MASQASRWSCKESLDWTHWCGLPGQGGCAHLRLYCSCSFLPSPSASQRWVTDWSPLCSPPSLPLPLLPFLYTFHFPSGLPISRKDNQSPRNLKLGNLWRTKPRASLVLLACPFPWAGRTTLGRQQTSSIMTSLVTCNSETCPDFHYIWHSEPLWAGGLPPEGNGPEYLLETGLLAVVHPSNFRFPLLHPRKFVKATKQR